MGVIVISQPLSRNFSFNFNLLQYYPRIRLSWQQEHSSLCLWSVEREKWVLVTVFSPVHFCFVLPPVDVQSFSSAWFLVVTILELRLEDRRPRHSLIYRQQILWLKQYKNNTAGSSGSVHPFYSKICVLSKPLPKGLSTTWYIYKSRLS